MAPRLAALGLAATGTAAAAAVARPEGLVLAGREPPRLLNARELSGSSSDGAGSGGNELVAAAADGGAGHGGAAVDRAAGGPQGSHSFEDDDPVEQLSPQRFQTL